MFSCIQAQNMLFSLVQEIATDAVFQKGSLGTLSLTLATSTFNDSPKRGRSMVVM